MRTWRSVVLGLAAAGLLSWQAYAQQTADDHTARLDLARQIVALRSEASEMTIFRAKLPYFSAAIAGTTRLSDGERAVLPDLVEHAYRAALVPAHEQISTTYADIFTTDQLQQVLAFYQSDAGKAFLAHQEELTNAGIALQRLVDAAVISSVLHSLEDQRRTSPQ